MTKKGPFGMGGRPPEKPLSIARAIEGKQEEAAALQQERDRLTGEIQEAERELADLNAHRGEATAAIVDKKPGAPEALAKLDARVKELGDLRAGLTFKAVELDVARATRVAEIQGLGAELAKVNLEALQADQTRDLEEVGGLLTKAGMTVARMALRAREAVAIAHRAGTPVAPYRWSPLKQQLDNLLAGALGGHLDVAHFGTPETRQGQARIETRATAEAPEFAVYPRKPEAPPVPDAPAPELVEYPDPFPDKPTRERLGG